jgi:hypothetical protein
MALDDEKYIKSKFNQNDDEKSGDSGESGEGGQTGQIEFRDFLAPAERFREDLLPPEERKRLLSVHKDIHELRVKKQKELRDQRQLLKDGKIPLQSYRQGLMGTGMNAQYKANPILTNKAQFSGIDRQVNFLPTEYVADTNPEQRNDLEYRYRLSYMPENAPRFHPKPLYR